MIALVRFLGTLALGMFVGDRWAQRRNPALARATSSGFRDVRARRAIPGPIEVLHGFMLRDQQPPAFVVHHALAEAELMGRHDLVGHLVRVFVEPAVYEVEERVTVAPPPIVQAAPPASQHAPSSPAPLDDNNSDSATDATVDASADVSTSSPLPGVADDQWAAFSGALAREAPTFDSNRHVGRYRQRKDRLRELGCDPAIVLANPRAQDVALAMDVADAARHLYESGTAEQHVGRTVLLPDEDQPRTITLSGVVGIAHAAGLEGCVGWLESREDRKRYPHTTKVFLATNGAF